MNNKPITEVYGTLAETLTVQQPPLPERSTNPNGFDSSSDPVLVTTIPLWT